MHSAGVLICPTPLASLVLRLCSPPYCLSGAVCGSGGGVVAGMQVADRTAAVALLLWQLGQGALCWVVSGSKSERPGFPSGLASGRLRSPPVASGRLRSPPVASGRPRSLGACLTGVGWIRVVPGWVWFGLWRDRSSKARFCIKFRVLASDDLGWSQGQRLFVAKIVPHRNVIAVKRYSTMREFEVPRRWAGPTLQADPAIKLSLYYGRVGGLVPLSAVTSSSVKQNKPPSTAKSIAAKASQGGGFRGGALQQPGNCPFQPKPARACTRALVAWGF